MSRKSRLVSLYDRWNFKLEAPTPKQLNYQYLHRINPRVKTSSRHIIQLSFSLMGDAHGRLGRGQCGEVGKTRSHDRKTCGDPTDGWVICGRLGMMWDQARNKLGTDNAMGKT